MPPKRSRSLTASLFLFGTVPSACACLLVFLIFGTWLAISIQQAEASDDQYASWGPLLAGVVGVGFLSGTVVALFQGTLAAIGASIVNSRTQRSNGGPTPAVSSVRSISLGAFLGALVGGFTVTRVVVGAVVASSGDLPLGVGLGVAGGITGAVALIYWGAFALFYYAYRRRHGLIPTKYDPQQFVYPGYEQQPVPPNLPPPGYLPPTV